MFYNKTKDVTKLLASINRDFKKEPYFLVFDVIIMMFC